MKVKLKIVGIGNSIVNGFPLKRSECFLSQIRELTGHEVINKGINGETTEDIVKRFSKDLLFHCPDIGIILTGTNDFIYKKATPEEAMKKLEWMVGKMEESQIKPVLLTPILTNPVKAASFWMADAGINYEEVNNQLKELGHLMLKKYPSYTLDMQTLFEERIRETGIEESTVDGLHPTAASHRLMAEIIVQNKLI